MDGQTQITNYTPKDLLKMARNHVPAGAKYVSHHIAVSNICTSLWVAFIPADKEKYGVLVQQNIIL